MDTLEQLGLEMPCISIFVKDVRPFAGKKWTDYKDEMVEYSSKR